MVVLSRGKRTSTQPRKEQGKKVSKTRASPIMSKGRLENDYPQEGVHSHTRIPIHAYMHKQHTPHNMPFHVFLFGFVDAMLCMLCML